MSLRLPVHRIRHIALYLQALRLALHAQSVRHAPLPQIIARITRLKGLPSRPDPLQAEWASRAASRHLAKLNTLDSCLIRALILGSMLCKQRRVILHIGFDSRHIPAHGGELVGHAWLSIGDKTYLENAGHRYIESIHFVMSRN